MKPVLFKPLSEIGWHEGACARPILASTRNTWDFVSFVWGKRNSNRWQWFPLYLFRNNCNVEVGIGLGKHFAALKFPSSGKPSGSFYLMGSFNVR